MSRTITKIGRFVFLINDGVVNSKIVLAIINYLQRSPIYNARTFNDLERSFVIAQPNKQQINSS